jgi:hypothetical protein
LVLSRLVSSMRIWVICLFIIAHRNCGPHAAELTGRFSSSAHVAAG